MGRCWRVALALSPLAWAGFALAREMQKQQQQQKQQRQQPPWIAGVVRWAPPKKKPCRLSSWLGAGDATRAPYSRAATGAEELSFPARCFFFFF